ncbi:MAG: hypothetical protein ACRDNY_13650 [Gaiellaceae bacterium]
MTVATQTQLDFDAYRHAIETNEVPEGQEVVCHVMLELRQARIARAQCVQAYDE